MVAYSCNPATWRLDVEDDLRSGVLGALHPKLAGRPLQARHQFGDRGVRQICPGGAQRAIGENPSTFNLLICLMLDPRQLHHRIRADSSIDKTIRTISTTYVLF